MYIDNNDNNNNIINMILMVIVMIYGIIFDNEYWYVIA